MNKDTTGNRVHSPPPVGGVNVNSEQKNHPLACIADRAQNVRSGRENAKPNIKIMGPLKLTRKQILNDIEVFKERIRAAEKKIVALPQRANGYKERKKLKLKRRVLEQEIEHAKGLIAIASEALKDGSLPPAPASLEKVIGKQEID